MPAPRKEKTSAKVARKKGASASLIWPTDYLELKDIFLWSSSLTRPELEFAIDPEKVAFLRRRGLKGEQYTVSNPGLPEFDFLRVVALFGVRAMHSLPDSEDRVEAFTLEAQFAADFLIKRELLASQAQEFVQKHAVHLVWPFWRAFVYSTLKQASLPIPAVPLKPPLKGATLSPAEPNETTSSALQPSE